MKSKIIVILTTIIILLNQCFSDIYAYSQTSELNSTIYACEDGYYNTSGGVMSWIGNIDRLGVSNTGPSP